MIKLPPLIGNDYEKIELGEEVTVAMSAYGNHASTLNALQALFLSARGDFELLLVEDCYPEDTTRSLFRQARAEHPNTTLFFFRENREYSGSLNAALSHARGRWVLFLSNDIYVTPDYLREVMAAARADPSNGIVRGCSNLVDNGKASHNVRLLGSISTFDGIFAAGRLVAGELPGEYVVDEFLTGDAFLVSRAVLDRIGTIDPAFFGYFADHDFGLRAQIAGFRQILVRRGFAYHDRGANFNYLPPRLRDEKLDRRWALIDRNWVYFSAKYGLPAGVQYHSIHDVPWKALASELFDREKHYVHPGDYLAEWVAAS